MACSAFGFHIVSKKMKYNFGIIDFSIYLKFHCLMNEKDIGSLTNLMAVKLVMYNCLLWTKLFDLIRQFAGKKIKCCFNDNFCLAIG